MPQISFKTVWVFAQILTLSSLAYAQAVAPKPAKAPKTGKAEPAPAVEAPPPEPPPPPAENTVDVCKDSADNDGDGHVDCDDQDCQIFALCVVSPEPAEAAPVEVPAAPPAPVFVPETGWQCRDGVDNNQDGNIDCHEISCQHSMYCKRTMYERPEPENKAPGLFMNIGFGIALPNFRLPTMETTWQNSSEEQFKVPFDPDMGIMLDFQIGYLFLKFMGAGLSFKSAFTFASNRSLYFDSDDDPTNYKYTGNKYYGNVSGFLRFQWPFRRVTPYINMHAGYSVSQATWNVYGPENSWNSIDDAEMDDDYAYMDRTEIRSDRNRHFTFALEPGVDLSVVRRLFAVGLRVWIPVVANEDSSADNLGVLINFNFTPMWREHLQLKPEFAKKP